MKTHVDTQQKIIEEQQKQFEEQQMRVKEHEQQIQQLFDLINKKRSTGIGTSVIQKQAPGSPGDGARRGLAPDIGGSASPNIISVVPGSQPLILTPQDGGTTSFGE